VQRAADEPTHNPSADHRTANPWYVALDVRTAHDTLAKLSAIDRAALNLRYLDGLTVGEVADHLGRTPGAAEALLTRAKAAFRAAYPGDNLEGGEQ
jgi:RNA polymerase sigma-70 factor (ECF subfamily)